jgi:hypothetical protein
VFTARWRHVAAVVCLAVAGWTAWFTADIVGEWVTTALVLAAPALIAVALAPGWRSGALITAVLLAALVGLAVTSTRWPGALRPPRSDWLLPYLTLAAVSWAVAYAVRVRSASPEQRTTLLLLGAGGLAVLLCLGAIVAGGRDPERPGSGIDLDVDRHDLLPFPVALDSRRISVDCQTGTGVCTEVIEVWSRSRRPQTEVTQQLVQHLRTKGWPMNFGAHDGRSTGCLAMRGVQRWADHVCATTTPTTAMSWPAGVDHREDAVILTLAANPDTARPPPT